MRSDRDDSDRRSTSSNFKDVREGIKTIEKADLDKDTAKANVEIARLTKAYPNNPSVFALNQNDSMKSRLADAQAFYAENNKRWVGNQKSLNQSSLPAIGDVEFPSDWTKLSERRLKNSTVQLSTRRKRGSWSRSTSRSR